MASWLYLLQPLCLTVSPNACPSMVILCLLPPSCVTALANQNSCPISLCPSIGRWHLYWSVKNQLGTRTSMFWTSKFPITELSQFKALEPILNLLLSILRQFLTNLPIPFLNLLHNPSRVKLTYSFTYLCAQMYLHPAIVSLCRSLVGGGFLPPLDIECTFSAHEPCQLPRLWTFDTPGSGS